MRASRLLAILALAVSAANAEPGPAPDFTLPSNTGGTLSLEDLRGQVVLVNFFASWCGPCRQELPVLSAMHERYARLGFTVLGVNVDTDRAGAERLLDELTPSFPVVYDPSGQASRLYRVNGMPNTAIVDREGRLRFRHRGYHPGVEMTYLDEVRQLLRER